MREADLTHRAIQCGPEMRPDNKARADAAQVRREQMIVLRESGMRDREIGEWFGITGARVRHLIQMGLDYRERNTVKGVE